MSRPYVAPFSLGDGPIVLASAPNEGWTVSQRTLHPGTESTPLGAFSDAESMLVALGDALLPEGKRIAFTSDVQVQPVHIDLSGIKRREDAELHAKAHAEVKKELENWRDVPMNAPPEGGHGDDVYMKGRLDPWGVDWGELTAGEKEILRKALIDDNDAFRRPGPLPHIKHQWTHGYITLPTDQMEQSDWDDIAGRASQLRFGNPDWSAKSAYQRACCEWLAAFEKVKAIRAKQARGENLSGEELEVLAKISEDGVLSDDDFPKPTIEESAWMLDQDHDTIQEVKKRRDAIIATGTVSAQAAQRQAINEIRKEKES